MRSIFTDAKKCGGVRRGNGVAMTWPNGTQTAKGGDAFTILLYDAGFKLIIP
jgi:hypothetical protein